MSNLMRLLGSALTVFSAIQFVRGNASVATYAIGLAILAHLHSRKEPEHE